MQWTDHQNWKSLSTSGSTPYRGGDPALIDRHISSAENDVRLTDPGEWFSGGPAVAEYLRGVVTALAGAATFTASGTEAYTEGTVGWATAHLRITLPDGNELSPRWSAVWHQEDGVWKFVQIHGSMGVPNEEVGWAELE